MTPAHRRNTIALVGAGTVGASWAVVFLRGGHAVNLFDVDPARREICLAAVRDGLASIGIAAPEAALSRVTWTSSIQEAVADAVYVQESVPEDAQAKAEILSALDAATPPSTIIASSTSAMPLGTLDIRAKHPERIVVAHPMNPPHIMPLVEVVPGPLTSKDTTEATCTLLRACGQRPLIINAQTGGFAVNRLQGAMQREALALVREGIASAADVDACVTEALALRWAFIGPLAIEEVQGESLEHVLQHFAPYFATVFQQATGPRGPLDEIDEQAFRDAARAALAGRSHDDLVQHRDEMVLALRRLKDDSA